MFPGNIDVAGLGTAMRNYCVSVSDPVQVKGKGLTLHSDLLQMRGQPGKCELSQRCA